ncbi:hypothetical protein [Nostoc sp. CHAB 5715]|uniref:hypothetical protein n=1 Tax=Nostoc sp. CHAB 5715 TaxID=2780400 RepID=UPI001E4A19EA|nr:hypothetical protein [Nostoc sp. CHAB 5715]MCC5619978.1 hypothetical protein [Nostoc sp. CHAB 5715]
MVIVDETVAEAIASGKTNILNRMRMRSLFDGRNVETRFIASSLINNKCHNNRSHTEVL